LGLIPIVVPTRAIRSISTAVTAASYSKS
jgi:hypothetical protein